MVFSDSMANMPIFMTSSSVFSYPFTGYERRRLGAGRLSALALSAS